MNPTVREDERIERLYTDHRRMGLIYGISIIIVTLTITGIVLYTPNFQWPFLFQSPALGVEIQPLDGPATLLPSE